jgi:hypothetical protein
VTWLERIAITPTERQKPFSQEIARINKEHKEMLSLFPSQLRAHWLWAFAWWAGGTILLFVAGWAVSWVYRGFRGNAA